MFRKLIIAVVLAAAAAYFFLVADSDTSEGIVLFDPRTAAAEEVTPEVASQEIEVPADVVEEPSADRALGAGVRVRGQVVLVSGAPIAGVAVVQRHPYLLAQPATSAADGSFEITLEEPRGELGVDDGPWLLLGGERFLSDAHVDDYKLVVAPAKPVHGRVVDQHGAGVRGVDVRAVAPSDVLVPLGIVATPLEDPRQTAITDGEGVFHIASAPDVAGARIQAALVGYQTAERALAGVAGELQLVLVAH